MVQYAILTNNPCFRCGKERVVKRTYKKKVDNSVITYTDTVCPDPECQIALELQLKIEREKREQMATQKEDQARIRLEEKRAARN